MQRLSNQDFLNALDFETNKLDIVTLKRLLEEYYGEKNDIDFKKEIIEYQKISKIILAMANNGGGVVIFGITDDHKPVGAEKVDATDFNVGIRKYVPENLKYEDYYVDYKEDEMYGEFSGKTFLILYIPQQYRFAPFMAIKKSGEVIKDNVIYIRKNTSNGIASQTDINEIIEKRIYEEYNDLSELTLETHIEQLKTLYKYSPKSIGVTLGEKVGNQISQSITVDNKINEHHPQESFNAFIGDLIKRKKNKIKQYIEV
ncbi:hypothetical protein GLW05_06545 [Pontibacillus yanchengensis]|uniref:Schlafen AlbA-2 domain-containing protein n=1 Tax=Pontibacillus yanchengensis TaxID=462910 RepID=A0A6I4ZSR4_9BACI|nr:ATP-binding protein [Pontibacillus yanchengensis]MYL33258.1 hypothetical protein [Pontibacillus yanchengensis]